MDTNSLNAMFASLFFSSIGVGYFIYGKRQANVTLLGFGMALIIYPYFVSGVATMVLVGLALIVAPFLFARFA